MDIDSVFTIVCSGVLAAVAAAASGYHFTRRIKKDEFDYDYKKYFLEKRKQAYNRVELFFMTDQSLQGPQFDGNGIRTFELRDRIKNITNAINGLPTLYSLWISIAMLHAINNYRSLLIEFQQELLKAVENYDFIEDYFISDEDQNKLIPFEAKLSSNDLSNIFSVIMIDLINLNDVDKFIRELNGRWHKL